MTKNNYYDEKKHKHINLKEKWVENTCILIFVLLLEEILT
jgi:hypothetical protein